MIFAQSIPYCIAFLNLNQSSNEIEWNFNVGDSFNWNVTKSNVTYGYLPVNSSYDLEIKSIDTWTGADGKESSQIDCIFQTYNISDKSTDVILNNKMFISFNNSLNETLLYDTVFNIPMLIPSTLQEDFYIGLTNFYVNQDVFDFGILISINEQIYKIRYINISNSIDVEWTFNNESKCTELEITDNDVEIFLLTLVETIENGDDNNAQDNNLLIIIIATIIPSLIAIALVTTYILKKKGIIFKKRAVSEPKNDTT